MDQSEPLQEIATQISACTLCNLHAGRTRAVPGEGPADAEIMCIGEGPGFYEDQQGRPFVGAAGKFLSELLAQAELKRENVFITNVVKCRPPENRDPQPDELTACRPYLLRQIEAINPKIIVTLGRFSMAIFMPEARISSVHGQARLVQGKIVVPMYHPAAALHQPLLKPTVEKDFAALKDTLRKIKEASQARAAQTEPAAPPVPQENVEAISQPETKDQPEDSEPKQMSLF